jgi:hypothetical protein
MLYRTKSLSLIRPAGAKPEFDFSCFERQTFESPFSSPVAALVTISGDGKFVRCWNPNDGVLLWETTTYSAAEGRASAPVDFALLSVSACYCTPPECSASTQPGRQSSRCTWAFNIASGAQTLDVLQSISTSIPAAPGGSAECSSCFDRACQCQVQQPGQILR